MSFLSVQNLRKSFPSVQVDISFEVEEGSFTCLLGPSGSGKSTVLRLIAGLLESETSSESDGGMPSRIILDGKDIAKAKPSKRDLGMVFQSPSLFMNMNVLDNVAYGLFNRGFGKKKSRIMAQEMLEKFDLGELSLRMPETLSGGEAQRVALTRTLIIKPKLVLFDEPLSSLDAPLRKKLASEILSMQKEFNFTGIMVTHDIQEAKTVSSRIILMKKGKKVWEGKSDSFQESLYTDNQQ